MLGFVTNGTSCTTATTVPYGSGYVLTVAVIDSGSVLSQNGTLCQPMPAGAFPTGTVTIADGTSPLPTVDGGGTFKLNGFGFFEDQQIQNLSVGTHSIQAAYLGDNSFEPSNTNAPISRNEGVDHCGGYAEFHVRSREHNFLADRPDRHTNFLQSRCWQHGRCAYRYGYFHCHHSWFRFQVRTTRLAAAQLVPCGRDLCCACVLFHAAFSDNKAARRCLARNGISDRDGGGNQLRQHRRN